MTALYAVAETVNGEREPVIWATLHTTVKEAINIKIEDLRETFEGDDETIDLVTGPFLEHKDTDHLGEGEYIEVWFLDCVVTIRRVVIAS